MRKLYLGLYSFLLIALFLVLFFRPVTSINEDLGRHILLGDIILRTHNIPEVNFLSYTNYNYPSFPTSWFSEVIYSFLNSTGGMNLILIFSTLIVVVAVLLQIQFVLKRFNILSILIASTIYLFLLASRTDVRPEIFSLFFMSFFITTLFSFREKINKRIFLLIPLQALWVNMHIYFFVGPLLVLMFLIDGIVFAKYKITRSVKILVKVFLGVIFAVFINPFGFKGASYPLVVVNEMGLKVEENQDLVSFFTFYQDVRILVPLLVVIFLFIFLLLNKKKLDFIDFIISLLFSLFVILVFRNVLLFVAATFIPFVKYLDLVIQKYSPILKKLPIAPLIFPLALFLLVILLQIIKTVELNSFGFGTKEKWKGAVDFIEKNNIHGPFFNNFDLSGYLIFRIYPELTYVDNRPDSFPVSFFQNIIIPMQKNPSIFDKENKKYNFNAIIVNHWDKTPWENRLFKHFLKDPDLKLVYLDSYAMVLVRNNEKNRTLIKEEFIDVNSVDIKKINNKNDIVGFLFLFEKVGNKEQAQKTKEKLRTFDPMFCELKKYPLFFKIPLLSFSNSELKNICPRSGIDLFNLL